MRRIPLALVALALAACQATVTGTVRPGTRSPAPATVTAATATPAASGGGASATPRASAAPATPKPLDLQSSLLKPPAGEYQVLTGTVLADPVWLKARGGGGVLSNNGSSFGALNGGKVISDNGSGLLVDGGGSLVAGNTGNVIPDEAHGLTARRGGSAALAPDGSLAAAGGIISDNGAAVISNNAGGIVSNNASGLIGNNAAGLTGKTKYSHLEVAERPPTAGMLVSAVSLRTHEYLPVGQDADGKPVYTVYSNMKGEYQLFLPKGEEGNVLVVTNAPTTLDSHLVFNAFTPAQAQAPVPVDQDVAEATRTMRQLFVAHMASLLTNATDDGYLNGLGNGGKAFDKQLSEMLKGLADLVGGHAKAAGVPSGPGAAEIPEVRQLAQELTDAGIGYVDVDQLRLSSLYAPDWDGPQEPALKALGQSFQQIRAATAAFLAVNPAPQLVTFTIDARVSDASPACATDLSVNVADETSMGRFIVDRVLAGRELHSIVNTRYAIEALAMPRIPPGTKLQYDPKNPDWYTQEDGMHQTIHKRINACASAIMGVLTLTLAPPGWKAGDAPPAAMENVLKQIDRFAASHTFSKAPVATPMPTCAPDAAATP